MEGCFSRAAIANDALRRRIAGVQRTALCCEREGSAVPASVLSSIPSPARLCQSKVFSRHHRGAHGSAGGRARAEWNHLSLMMVAWENETRRDEGNATYCQTSNPSLSNSTSTTSEDKWKCVVRVWGEKKEKAAGRAGDVCSSVRSFAVTRADPALRKAFRGANQTANARNHNAPGTGAQKWVFRPSASSLEASCLPHHTA